MAGNEEGFSWRRTTNGFLAGVRCLLLVVDVANVCLRVLSVFKSASRPNAQLCFSALCRLLPLMD